MQILHWTLTHPQTGSRFIIHSSSPFKDQGITESHVLGASNTRTLAHQRPLLATLLSPRRKNLVTMESQNSLSQYLNNNTKKEGLRTEFDLDASRPQPPQDVLITAGDGRRNNPGDDGQRQPGEHYREIDKRLQKRKRISPDYEEDEEDSLLTDSNGYKFEHSDKAYLILNLYAGERDGYTFTAYLPETPTEEATMFRESHLIPYSETYLIDCINNETVPLRLVRTLEQEHGIDLVRYRNCLVCEVRDFRRSFSSTPEKYPPVCRQVVLKPTTETLLADLESLIFKGHDDRAMYKKVNLLSRQNQSSVEENELIAFKRMRLSNPNYPFDGQEQDKTLCGISIDVEDDGNVLTLDQRHELEKKIVKETAGGLCLDPSKQVGVIANCAQYERFKWNSKELKRSLRANAKKRRKLTAAPLPRNVCMVSDDEDGVEEEKKDEVEGEIVADENDENELNVDPPPLTSILFRESTKSYRKDVFPLLSFINRSIESKKLKREIVLDKSQILKLPQIKPVDNTLLPMFTNYEEIRPVCQPMVEPASIRPLPTENHTIKTEEYVFETERRKHPHRTVVKIFQRNGVDNYFGELEQDAFSDDPNSGEPGTVATRGNAVPIKPYTLDPPTGEMPGSKCQFELGSLSSVNLYVKQFMDIYTEDGRRPCKITIQKAGQANSVHTYLTSSYKALLNGNNSNSNSPSAPSSGNSSTGGNVHVGANVVIAHSGSPTPPHNSSNTIIVSVPNLHNTNLTSSTISIPITNSTSAQQTPTASVVPVSSSSSPSQSNPPVQIVHPQPRPQPSIQSSAAHLLSSTQSLTTSSLTTTTPITNQSHTTPTNVNLNLHVNSARVVQQRHQLLTRPQIYNVSLTQQQQQQLNTMTRPTAGTIQQAPQLIQSQPQHHHQQGIRVKQPTLATLLLTSLPNSGSKPITVAIQPQPQNHGLNQINSNHINVNQLQTIQLNNSSLDQHHQLATHGQPQQVQISSHGHGGNQSNNQIMIMVSPAPGNTLTGQNSISIPSGNTTHHAIGHQTGNVSLNLNAINLEGLLGVSHNNGTTIQQQPTYVSSTALVNSSNSIATSMGLNAVSVSNASPNTLNILRLSNNTGTVTLQPQHLIRQNSVSVMNQQSQQTTMVNMSSSSGSGTLVNSTHNSSSGNSNGIVNSNSPRLQQVQLNQAMRQQAQQQPPELEEISVPDLNTLLSNGCGNNRISSYTRTTTKVPSIDLNLNLNLNLSGTSPAARPIQTQLPTMNEHYSNGAQNGSPVVNVNSVDSIFNALSEAMGPDLDQKLENSISTGHVSSSLSPSPAAHTPKGSVLTLNDLLGSPPIGASTGNASMTHAVSSPMQSPQSPSISSILSPISPNVTSSMAYTTPRLSALLAGTPSADSSSNNILIESTPRAGIASSNYGNLLDRLMSQGQAVATPQQRAGGSRLNPIATATPSVVLDHPVLAATLTQGANPNLRQALTRPTTYRQIAPAPPQPTPQQQQQQQLINNLLGFVGTNNSGTQGGPPQAIRSGTTSQTSSGTGGSGNVGSR